MKKTKKRAFFRKGRRAANPPYTLKQDVKTKLLAELTGAFIDAAQRIKNKFSL